MNLSAVALIAVITTAVLTPSVLVLCNNTVNQMNQLNTQLSNEVNGTIGFMDHAWNIAQEFQNASYHYDPSELGNYTVSDSP